MNCKSYSSVEVINTSFEEWGLEPEAFDAVLAASSMHWIPAEIAYAKASRALKEGGYLGTPEKRFASLGQMQKRIRG
jgi:SAM-dependent methyltransferase